MASDGVTADHADSPLCRASEACPPAPAHAWGAPQNISAGEGPTCSTYGAVWALPMGAHWSPLQRLRADGWSWRGSKGALPVGHSQPAARPNPPLHLGVLAAFSKNRRLPKRDLRRLHHGPPGAANTQLMKFHMCSPRDHQGARSWISLYVFTVHTVMGSVVLPAPVSAGKFIALAESRDTRCKACIPGSTSCSGTLSGGRGAAQLLRLRARIARPEAPHAGCSSERLLLEGGVGAHPPAVTTPLPTGLCAWGQPPPLPILDMSSSCAHAAKIRELAPGSSCMMLMRAPPARLAPTCLFSVCLAKR